VEEIAWPLRRPVLACFTGAPIAGAKPMRRRQHPIESLRDAIDCLPLRTRTAMLEGVRSNDIIVGAYSTRDGGICPMLAAHRCGGRTDFISFAHAWDRFAVAKRARPATDREVRILTTHLEASLLTEYTGPLPDALREHRALVRSNEHDPAGPVRVTERLRRPTRRERAEHRRLLERIERERDAAEAQAELDAFSRAELAGV
jgi:hypothetical protein